MANTSHRSENKFSVPDQDIETSHGRPEAGENSFLLGVLLDIQRDLGKVTAKLDNVEASIGKLDAKVDKLETRVDRLEAKVDKLETKVEASISKLEVKVEDIDKKVSALTSWKNAILAGSAAIAGVFTIIYYGVDLLKKLI